MRLVQATHKYEVLCVFVCVCGYSVTLKKGTGLFLYP